MLGQRLRTGMRVKLAGQEHTIEQRLPNGKLQLKHTVSGTMILKATSYRLCLEGRPNCLVRTGRLTTSKQSLRSPS